MANEETPIEIDLAKLKRRKYVLSGTTAVMLLGLAWVSHEKLAQHLDVHLFTQAEAQAASTEQNEQIRKAAAAAESAAAAAQNVTRSLDAYVKRQDLKEAKQRLSVLEQQLGETQLWEAANGVNDISRARRTDLTAQIATTRAYIACLDAGRTDCAQ